MDSASENEEMSNTYLGSNTSHYLVADDAEDSRDGDDSDRGNAVLREQDRFLPIANVARLMKKSIPKTGKIAKDARECVQECVSEFVSFITSEASDRCHQEKRKTINGEDILFAMSSLGFDNYVDPLKQYLQKYREAMKGDKSLTMGESYPIVLNEEMTEELLQGNESQVNTGASSSDIDGGQDGGGGGGGAGVIFTYATVQPNTGNSEFTIV